MSKIIFREVQRVRQWWIWAIVALTFLGYAFCLLERFYISSPFEEHEIEQDWVIIAFGAIPIVFFLFVITMKLVVEICDDGIYYKFFPFTLRYHFIGWDEIDKIYIRKYSPIKEYGGWGIRFGYSIGKAFTISGDWGLQLELKNEKRILFGTRKRASMENVVIVIKEKTGVNNIEMYGKDNE